MTAARLVLSGKETCCGAVGVDTVEDVVVVVGILVVGAKPVTTATTQDKVASRKSMVFGSVPQKKSRWY